MAKYLTDEYRAVVDRVQREYGGNAWPLAKRWRGRVGLPRLIAEGAAYLALRVLKDINAGVFRNDPNARALLDQARDAADELYGAIARENWRRFDATPEQTGENR